MKFETSVTNSYLFLIKKYACNKTVGKNAINTRIKKGNLLWLERVPLYFLYVVKLYAPRYLAFNKALNPKIFDL